MENKYPGEAGPAWEDLHFPGAVSTGLGNSNPGEACPAGRGVQSATQTPYFITQFNAINELLNSQENKNMLQEVHGEDIAIFIGNTKCGKSTLINYVIGNQLKAERMEDYPHTMTIVKANSQERGPVIGFESISETTLPSIWSATKSGIREKVVDAPGFEDNRGVAQDIANMFYLREIIRNARSVKFVLITDINDIIHQNIKGFTDFIDKMHLIFPDTRVLYGGIALVISKEMNQISVDNVCNILKKKVLKQNKMDVEKSLINYFVDHKECISFFKMPSSEGLLSALDIDRGILDVIGCKITGIFGGMLSNVKPGISPKSRGFLHQTHADFTNGGEYLDLLQNIKKNFENQCVGVSQISSLDEYEAMTEAIKTLNERFLRLFPQHGAELSFDHLIEKLGSLCDMCGITEYMYESNIAVQIKFVKFLDEILGLNNGQIYTNQFQATIKDIESNFEGSRLALAIELSKLRLLEIEKLKTEQAVKHTEEMKKRAEDLEAEMVRRELDEKAKEEMRAKARLEEEKLRKELDAKTQEEIRITKALRDQEEYMRKLAEKHAEEMKRLQEESDRVRKANEAKIARQAEELKAAKGDGCNIL